MGRVLVLGAEEEAVRAALAEAGGDDDVIVLDALAERLERLYETCPDPRLWFEIGDAEVVPLPDRSVDEAIGERSEDVLRVLR